MQDCCRESLNPTRKSLPDLNPMSAGARGLPEPVAAVAGTRIVAPLFRYSPAIRDFNPVDAEHVGGRGGVLLKTFGDIRQQNQPDWRMLYPHSAL
jgi:hypothetical protein